MTLRTRFLAAAFATAVPVLAAAQTAPATIDLLPGWRDETGPHIAALRIRLAPGWKTYWRAPGEAGIPPVIDAAGSSNLAALTVRWPTPKVFDQNGLTSVGYSGDVILPIELRPIRPDAPIDVRLSLDLGVCEDICVPMSAQLSGRLAVGGRVDPAISRALSSRPLTEAEARSGPLDCHVALHSEGARVTARVDLPPLGGSEYAVMELSDPSVWVSEATVDRRGDALTVTAELVPPPGAPMSLDRSGLRLTILGQTGAADLRGCD